LGWTEYGKNYTGVSCISINYFNEEQMSNFISEDSDDN